VHLNDPGTHPLGSRLKEFESLDFLGADLESEVAKRIAECEIDP
jgi:hypothetical protein